MMRLENVLSVDLRSSMYYRIRVGEANLANRCSRVTGAR